MYPMPIGLGHPSNNMIFNTNMSSSTEDSMASLQKAAAYGVMSHDESARQGPNATAVGVAGHCRRLYTDMQHSIDGILGNGRARAMAGSPRSPSQGT